MEEKNTPCITFSELPSASKLDVARECSGPVTGFRQQACAHPMVANANLCQRMGGADMRCSKPKHASELKPQAWAHAGYT